MNILYIIGFEGNMWKTGRKLRKLFFSFCHLSDTSFLESFSINLPPAAASCAALQAELSSSKLREEDVRPAH